MIALRALSVALLATLPAFAQREVPPSPEEFLGQQIGADRFLADYTQLQSYWTVLAEQSERMELERIGETSYGQPHWVAVISSPENLARREEIRLVNQRLALGRITDEAEARQTVKDSRAVIWIDAGMHATESVAAQNILELVWQMVSRDDDEVRRILDEVVLLVCPANPDGMEMVAKGYMATGRVGRLPVLYQRYVGHDNNRDHYAGNQAEEQNILRMLYRRWHPQIVYNHHQTAPRGTILFTPPFRDPFNYNIDPLVIRGIELVAAHVNHRFASEFKPGIISRSGASYSTWWNGGLRTTVYFHNQIGILTEAFGSPNPTPIRQTLNRRLPYSDYPDPVPSQTWHARQTIDYLQTSNFAILSLASKYRDTLQLDQWRMARRQIDHGSNDHWTPTPKLLGIAREREKLAREDDTIIPAFEDPSLRDARHYVMPADQPDFSAAVRLARVLRRGGVEVHRLMEATDLPGHGTAPKGSFVVHAAQAFRAHLRDMLEPQWHPDDLDGGEPVRPYDSAGWTMSMQMGVDVVKLLDPIDLPCEPITEVEVSFPPSDLGVRKGGWLLDPRDSNLMTVVQRLHRSGAKMKRLSEAFSTDEHEYPAGAVHVEQSVAAQQMLLASAVELGVEALSVDEAPSVPATEIKPVRVGLFDVYGGNMPTGWCQWVLEQFEVPVELVFGDRIEKGSLNDDYDVLLFHTGIPAATQRAQRENAFRGRNSLVNEETITKMREALPAFEDWSTLEARATRISRDKGVPNLKAFVENGGTLLAFGRTATSVAKQFELPVEEGVRVEGEDGKRRAANSSEWFVPGSLLDCDVETVHPLGYGARERQAFMFRRSPVFRSTDPARARVVATYANEGELLRSGWAIGADLTRGGGAVVDAKLGDGRVVLFGADAMYRGQPVGTFKFVFNAILAAGQGE